MNQFSAFVTSPKACAHLHQHAERDGAGEVARRGDEDREHHDHHAEGRGQPDQVPFGPVELLHHAGDAAEGALEPALLVGLAADHRDALAVLAEPHQREAVVALDLVAARVDVGHPPPDEPGRRGSGRGVEQRREHHVAGDLQLLPGHRHVQGAGQRPEDADEGREQDHRVQEAHRQLHRRRGGPAGVLADALVRVVGGALDELHPVVRGAGEHPALQVPHQPVAPPHLERLPRVHLEDGGSGAGQRQHDEQAHLPQEALVVALVERVEEVAVPDVEAHLDRDLKQRQHDNDGGDRPGGASFLRTVVGRGEAPHLAQEADPPLHVGPISPVGTAGAVFRFHPAYLEQAQSGVHSTFRTPTMQGCGP